MALLHAALHPPNSSLSGTLTTDDGRCYTIDSSVTGLLGQGGQGVVRVATRDADGVYVAIKTGLARELRLEVAALSRLDHPNIVRLEAAAVGDETAAFAVIELVTGGELFDEVLAVVDARQAAIEAGAGRDDDDNDDDECGDELLRPTSGGLSHARTQLYASQLLSALAHCHARGVCHRDVKAENVLLDGGSGRLKLIDFGLAMVAGEAAAAVGVALLSRTQCGSIMYAAPELLDTSPYAPGAVAAGAAPGAKQAACAAAYSPAAVDVWSAGIVVYAMLTGTLPFACAHVDMCARYAAFLAGGPAQLAVLPVAAVALLARMLCTDPALRATAAELLGDPWLTSEVAKAQAAGAAASAARSAPPAHAALLDTTTEGTTSADTLAAGGAAAGGSGTNSASCENLLALGGTSLDVAHTSFDSARPSPTLAKRHATAAPLGSRKRSRSGEASPSDSGSCAELTPRYDAQVQLLLAPPPAALATATSSWSARALSGPRRS